MGRRGGGGGGGGKGRGVNTNILLFETNIEISEHGNMALAAARRANVSLFGSRGYVMMICFNTG